ncbi:transmembrane protein 256 homolog isoform X2 [Olea europaea var. sylvestris]|uniref:transmembrane protein 256 homolog isoform X2 n=1 Tax=Olea europaea var. sylvestris TaxID=158386 RepID=UPI000C1CD30C|nr:transmembrane protein 256 homolog isoform X2 [Olea europaea var. sylvestris]
MDSRIWHKVAAISGIAALGLGTYGAHAFKPKNPSYKEVWQTASLYHLVHTAALVAAPITSHPNIYGSLLTAGILAFSGTSSIKWTRNEVKQSVLFKQLNENWRGVTRLHT